MNHTVVKQPWIALLGLFPPVYLVGLIVVWGNREYRTMLFDFWSFTIEVPAYFWWPVNLFNRARERHKDFKQLKRRYRQAAWYR